MIVPEGVRSWEATPSGVAYTPNSRSDKVPGRLQVTVVTEHLTRERPLA
jgi:hypothetical protein